MDFEAPHGLVLRRLSADRPVSAFGESTQSRCVQNKPSWMSLDMTLSNSSTPHATSDSRYD
jgi:hypothetical protein